MNNSNLNIIKVNQYFLERKEIFNKEVGEVIKNVRTQKGFTIDTISMRAISSPAYINQVEKGKYGLSLSKFISICNALEISPNKLLEEFIYTCEINEEILYNNLQIGKNISQNIINYMKEKNKL